MIVEEIMNQNVVTLHPNDTIKQQSNDTHERHSAHSIVDQNNHVVGIISDRDVRCKSVYSR